MHNFVYEIIVQHANAYCILYNIMTWLAQFAKKNRLQLDCKRFNEYVCQKLSMVQSLEELAEQLVDAIAALVTTKQPIDSF